jgi:tRNA modification GTPase
VCVLTPEGRGAIAVLRVWGPDAIAAADAVFRTASGQRLAESRPGRPRFGRVGAGTGDEVVAVVIDTDPPEVEIHGHGGSSAVALVVDALVAAGVERRQPFAWVRHVARSTMEAEAQVDLSCTPTVRAAEILLDQMHGALARELAEIARLARSDASVAYERLERLMAHGLVGLRLTRGWTVVLAGRPNVGKSRLLNALAGYERAIVSPTPGTTRDVVSLRTALDGWPIELSDTAGLCASADPVEAEGVALARAHQAKADLTLLVLDRSEPLTEVDRSLLREPSRALVVANKADLPAAWTPTDPSTVTVSAERGDGLEWLVAAIVQRLVPDPPDPGAGVPFRPRHLRALHAVCASLHARDAITATVRLAALMGSS